MIPPKPVSQPKTMPTPSQHPPRTQNRKTTQPSTVSTEKPPTPQIRRSGRSRKSPTRFGFDGTQGKGYITHFVNFTSQQSPFSTAPLFPTQPHSHRARMTQDPDTLTWEQAMKSSEKSEWLAAAQREIDGLVKQNTWTEVPTTDALTKIIPGTWTFRRKRNPDGEVTKHKARYCCRGDLEEPNGETTYSPVVAWSTIRTFFSLSLLSTTGQLCQSIFLQLLCKLSSSDPCGYTYRVASDRPRDQEHVSD